ncbi:MAG: hypothetical protein ACLUFV_09775 [Acutalibacteraceae bacterium]
MKKIIAFALTVCLVFAVAGVFASAVTLNPVENITSYTTPNVNGYGLEWYNDEEGEFKLFDGKSRTRICWPSPCPKRSPRTKLNEWYAWKGWIALAKTVDSAFERASR